MDAGEVRIALLAEHPESVPVLAAWFLAEWHDYYGPEGPGDAEADIRSYARRDGLPLGMVAFVGGELCGIAAIKSEPYPSHPDLGPWAAAGYVVPVRRGKGIGAALLRALEGQARTMGYPKLYCYTGTSDSLLARGGWELLDEVVHDGSAVRVYAKSL